MILAVDIGNSNIMFGGISEDKIHFIESISCDRSRTQTEYTFFLKNIAILNEISDNSIDGAIIASVVPQLTSVVRGAIKKVYKVDAMVIGPGIKTGLNILLENPAQLGSDILVNSVAAVSRFNGPLIVVDMGTATTFCVVNSKNQYIGGIIAPGIRIALDSLVSKTSLLHQIEFEPPKNVIGKNTAECMKSGIMYYNASAIDGLIERIEKEIGEKCTVIATGAPAKAIIPLCARKDIIIDEYLVLKGLKVIYDKNHK